MPLGGKVSSSSAAVGFIAFFLPWILVSCGGQSVKISGYNLAGANGPLAGIGEDPQGELFLVLLAFIGALVVNYRYLQRLTITVEESLGLLLLGGLSLLIMLGVYSEFQGELTNSDPWTINLATIQYGFWLSLFAPIGVLYGGYLNYREKGTPFAKELDRLRPVARETGARLEVISQKENGKLISLEGDRLTIGRSSKANIQLTDKTVSRIHARLAFATGVWFLQDLESSGGTYLNDQKIIGNRINDGDIIRIGQTEFLFHS